MALNHSPRIVTDGLVLCLDAANIKSYPGSGTTWTDLSGNSNNGTLTNGPTFNSNNSGSIVFDGSNDYVDNTFSFSSRPFTINSWIYFNSLTSWQTVLGQDTSQATALGAFYFQKTSNSGVSTPRINNSFGLALITTTNAEIYCYDTTTVSTGIWYNYCVSVSTTDLKLYKNGSLITTTSSSDTLAATTGSIKIGAGYYNNSIVDYINGRIPQVSIYNRTLTAAEVQQNFTALRGRYGI